MKFSSLVKTLTNIGTGVLIGQPIFAQERVEPLLPQHTSNKIVSAIGIVELMGQKLPALTGPDKLEVAASLVGPLVLQSSALIGAEVDDQERVDLGIQQITNGWNNVLKGMKKK